MDEAIIFPPQMNMAITSLLGRGGMCVRVELLSKASSLPSQGRDELRAGFVPCSHPATSSLPFFSGSAGFLDQGIPELESSSISLPQG